LLAEQHPEADVQLWLELMEFIYPDEEARDYVLDWMAHQVQFPGVKRNHGCLTGGAPRIGKDAAWVPVLRALGAAACSISERDLAGQYDDHYVNRLLVCFQELSGEHGSPMHEDVLKGKLAAPPDRFHLNPKGKGKVDIPNVVNHVAFSNREAPLNISHGDERWFCYQTPADWGTSEEEQKEKTAFFEAYFRWLEADGQAGIRAVLGWLQRRKITTSFTSAPPMTQWKKDLMGVSGGRVANTLRRMIEDRAGAFRMDMVRLSDIKTCLPPGDYYPGADDIRRANDSTIVNATREIGLGRPIRTTVKVDGKPLEAQLIVVRGDWAKRKHRERWDHYWEQRLAEGLSKEELERLGLSENDA